MKITEFNNLEMGLSTYTYKDEKQNIWFRGKDIVTALGYKDTDDSIRKHVDSEDKKSIPGILPGSNRSCIFINKSGMYSLVLRCKLEEAKKFKRWVTNEVLLSIRKYGFHSPNRNVFKIENEYDLHTRVTSYIRRFYPNALMIAGLG